MEEPSRISFRNGRLASRKAEEAALRRFHAVSWLEKMAGPLGLPTKPSEQEFVSCLKSGLVLCNAINKIQPGAVPKVVANQSLGLAWENQTLPAYQYFENIRNFLVAVDELNIPSFEASDIEKDTMEAGSIGKIVDCVLGLKAFHEWKQSSRGNGLWKYVKSPTVSHTKARIHLNMLPLSSSIRCLEMSAASGNVQPIKADAQGTKDKIKSIVKEMADILFKSKENIDQNLLDSWHQGTMDPVKLLNRIISTCFQEEELKFSNVTLMEKSTMLDVCNLNNACKNCSFCLGKATCNHWQLLNSQETELQGVKDLLSKIKLECAAMQSQVQEDLSQIGNQFERLSVAVVGYQKAVEENRNLYNMLQELKGNIQVFCRVRPAFVAGAKCSIDCIGNDGTLILLDPRKSQNLRKAFQFSKVFGPNSTQEEVYKETESLIRSVMDGYNVCILAYGQTGSGKTYSMCGPGSGSSKDIGINSKALNALFQISCTREDIKYEIQVQMVEIYNEQVRDLLSEENLSTKLEIRNCLSNGGLSLPDATMLLVRSTSDVMRLMKAGEKNRTVSCTAMNNRSSRSHSVLTIHVCGRDVLGSKLQSCLHLVDLAGSERVDKSEVTGDRLKEAQHINKSLSCLGDVISALAQKNSHIPYRNSKLTLLLQNSLGGHAKMLMLAHISPEAESYGETISTLKFAQRVSTVELGAAHINKESSEICQLREQVDTLKKELASKGQETALYLLKTKENTSERSKQCENSGILKPAIVNYTDERELLMKTPLTKSKFTAGHSAIRHRRLSLENSGNDKSRHQSSNSESDHYSETAEEQIKEISHEKIKENSSIKKFSPVNEIFSQAFSVNQPGVPGSRFGTPDTSKTKSSSNIFSSSKGSQIRRTIGKFINGSEKRSNQVKTLLPTPKQDKELQASMKSPATVESRYMRRQSLTNLQIPEVKTSRRSSLGGKSVESYQAMNDKMTTSLLPSSEKGAKRWL